MRGIKFRSWSKTYQQMVYVDNLFLANDSLEGHTDTKPYINQPFPRRKEVLMQFTGCLDKNDKEIYEGDIVSGNWPYAKKCIVVWDDKRCGFFCKPTEGEGILGRAAYDKYYKMNANKLEIIGNLWENKEGNERERDKVQG